ncbi:PREDICTED: proline-rich acidic protein 1 [Elephantulus edwardii]|uniref:proline-rich acidic protein 1 n=1 Tax=Elephantulus edwardii TaxID=28737 RepID=UPI0003F0ED64|nr:PREDICTED: proline-rich acidic protein 1 [Elephantulus edwardii]
MAPRGAPAPAWVSARNPKGEAVPSWASRASSRSAAAPTPRLSADVCRTHVHTPSWRSPYATRTSVRIAHQRLPQAAVDARAQDAGSRLILLASLVAVMLQEEGTALVLPGSVSFKGKDRTSEQDTKETWRVRAVEPLEKDWLMGYLPGQKDPAASTTDEKLPGDEAWVKIKDNVAPFWNPLEGPEPEQDHPYHPTAEETQGVDGPWPVVLLAHQILQGPEEDRDHIYHPQEP